jgi:dTDP-4-dehydrorhamnose reductase
VPIPCTAYGVSKLAGELMVAGERAPHLIVRTSAVFGDGGSRDKPLSFVRRMVDRARRGEVLAIVDDQTIATTHAGDLAAALVELVERGARGLYHVTNAGSCTWHELATEALRIAGVSAEIRRVRTEDLGAPARRPLHSAMESVRLAASGITPLRPWRAALQEYLTR